jgi:hypothetical protein
MKPARLLDGAPYTPAAATTPEYLRAKFKRIQREMEAAKKVDNVTALPKKKKAS